MNRKISCMVLMFLLLGCNHNNNNAKQNNGNILVITTGYANNIVTRSKPLTITVIIAQSYHLPNNVLVTLNSADEKIINLSANSCNIIAPSHQCSIEARAVALGETNINAAVTQLNLSASDKFTVALPKFQPSLDPSNILPKPTAVIPDIVIGKGTTEKDPIKPGYGVDSRSSIHNSYNNCLANKIKVSYSNPRFFYPISFYDGLEMLNMYNSLLREYTDSNDADFARSTESTGRAISIYYRSLYTQQYYTTKTFPKLSQYALDLLAKSDEDFLSYCGDLYNLGGWVQASMLTHVKVNFENAANANQFRDNSPQFDKLQVMQFLDSLEKFSKVFQKDFILTLSPKQIGGTTKELDDIFKKYGLNEQKITCTASNFNQCKQVLQAIFDYSINDFPNNIKDPNTWSLASSNYMTYSIDPDHPLNLPDLTKEYEDATSQLANKVEVDRGMYNFLIHYKQQSFSSLLDEDMKKKVETLITDYYKMISSYVPQSHAIENCIKDILHLDTKCLDSIKTVNSIRDQYADSISSAKALSSIIIVTYNTQNFSDMWQDILIPLDLESTCEGTEETKTPKCHGKFALYKGKKDEHYFSDVATCFVDTTLNNSYFKQYHPQWVGKSIYCTFKDGEIDHTYVKNSDNYQQTLGHSFKASPEQEIDDPDTIDLLFIPLDERMFSFMHQPI